MQASLSDPRGTRVICAARLWRWDRLCRVRLCWERLRPDVFLWAPRRVEVLPPPEEVVVEVVLAALLVVVVGPTVVVGEPVVIVTGPLAAVCGPFAVVVVVVTVTTTM